ncbi:MAG TPA: hypothetical protein VL026_02135 [Rhizomicrobium sp.]|nr:hypothetical protein [Rhizomicrobium sp.]
MDDTVGPTSGTLPTIAAVDDTALLAMADVPFNTLPTALPAPGARPLDRPSVALVLLLGVRPTVFVIAPRRFEPFAPPPTGKPRFPADNSGSPLTETKPLEAAFVDNKGVVMVAPVRDTEILPALTLASTLVPTTGVVADGVFVSGVGSGVVPGAGPTRMPFTPAPKPTLPSEEQAESMTALTTALNKMLAGKRFIDRLHCNYTEAPTHVLRASKCKQSVDEVGATNMARACAMRFSAAPQGFS